MDRPRRRVCLTLYLEGRMIGLGKLSNISKYIGEPLTFPNYSIRSIEDFSCDFDRKVDEWIPAQKANTLIELQQLVWKYRN